MVEITAALVKALREETRLGMMACKKALQEVKGDIEAAKLLLRRKGLTTAEKKAGRATGEGLVTISINSDRTAAAMVEVCCETDFCARNDDFRTMVGSLADIARQAADGKVEPTDAMKEALQATLMKIGENTNYTRGVKITAPRVGTYVHHNGKVGVLVGVEGEISEEMLTDLCMHVAFADPTGITKDDIPAELIERERSIAMQQATDSGKPENIVEKIVAGKINKFLAARALLEQPFVRDDKKKVKDILGSARVTAFARFAVGT